MTIKKILPKKDVQKIRKLEKALHELQEGKTSYFSITKLISMKSLCKDTYYAIEFCLYMALLIEKKMNISSPVEHEDKEKFDYFKRITNRAVNLLDSTVFTRKWLTPQAVILPLYPDLSFR